MEAGSFIIGGKTSQSLKMVIQDRPDLVAPLRRVEHKNPYGYDGSIPFDEGAYDTTDLSLLIWVDGPNPDEARNKVLYAFDKGSFIDFIPYFDENKTYKVMLSREGIKFTNKFFYDGGVVVDVALIVQPWKYYRANSVKMMTSAGEIVNPYISESLPKITITGDNDITLKVNGKDFVIKNVEGSIILDSLSMFAYKESDNGVITNQNSKIYTRNYPVLKSGNNTISWTGTVSKVEIDPRWRSLI